MTAPSAAPEFDPRAYQARAHAHWNARDAYRVTEDALEIAQLRFHY